MKNKINKLQLNKRELEVFSDELLNEFEMMETYAGAASPTRKNNCDRVKDCVTKILCGVTIKWQCSISEPSDTTSTSIF